MTDDTIDFSDKASQPHEKLRIARASQSPKMSARELGDMLGVGQRVVYAWEKGEYKPSLHHQVELARILGINIAGIDYLAGSPEPVREPLNPEVIIKIDMAAQLLNEVWLTLLGVDDPRARR